MPRPYYRSLKYSIYLEETAFLRWITERGFKFMFAEIRPSCKVYSFPSHNAISSNLCRRDKNTEQCKDPTYIKVTVCRQARHTYGFQYVMDLGSGQVKTYAQRYEALLLVKTSGSTSVQMLLLVLNFSTEVILKGNHSSWQARLSLDSVCFVWVVIPLLGSVIASGRASKLKMTTDKTCPFFRHW